MRGGLLIGGLICLAWACEPGGGCNPGPVTNTRRPAQPPTRPSTAQVTPRAQTPEPEYTYAPPPGQAAPDTRHRETPKPPPPPRQVNGVWRYSTAAGFLDEFLGGKKKSRFRARVQVTGKVHRIVDMGRLGGRRLWLDAGAGRFVEARFRDNGQGAMHLRQGRTVTVDCRTTAAIGKNAQLNDCVLR